MRMKVIVPAALLMLQMAGCGTLPDYGLARQAAHNGDPDLAIRHLEPLAEFGMPEAQVLLGDLYRDRDDLQSFSKTEALYIKAAEAGYARAYGRLGKLYLERLEDGDKSYLEKARDNLELALESGDTSVIISLAELFLSYPESAGDRDVKALILQAMDEGNLDANYALVRYYQLHGEADDRKQEIADLCRKALPEVPECYLEMAEIYQQQPDLGDVDTLLEKVKEHFISGRLNSGRVWKIAMWLADRDRLHPRPAESMQLLKMIEKDFPRALYGQARLMMDFPVLGSTDQLLEVLQRGREAGLAEAEMLTGKLYYSGKLVPLDAVKAEKHLLTASKEIARAHYFLGNIYQKGFLGKDDPRRAVDHFLIAARAGTPYADYALAEYFWKGVGIKRNAGYAYSFAKLAVAEGYTRAEALLEEIKASVTPETVALGDIIALREQTQRNEQMVALVSDQEEGSN
ncbi:hypothetical protein BTA51_04685 [Hahella sp. CCB-MM4]|uniref:tetratricopeptide repeat protein n=1 Tax=Hahella sp. (strain CCB-MM4) TaxID=1926491 RepID=UPI000B9BE40D|nr:SEL1-like repeat protein [Hahella sp. CCB-MM4]OZG74313.1 hypothetical protein BTA51_04685 [Hahella sp. CCB-MM4]